MTDQELIKQLGKLKSVTPEAGYVSVSRFIITTLKPVSPSPEFAHHSKSIILQSPRTLTGKILRVFSLNKFTAQAGLSLAFAGLLIALITGSTSGLRSIPDIDSAGITLEAREIMKNIDIRLEEASYFIATADAARFALNDASENGPTHTNATIIQHESDSFEFNNPTNSHIDDLLKEAAG